jgi:subfamily B ATP-binding cassette protein MsbA
MTRARILRYLRPYRRRIAWAVAAMTAVALFNGTVVLLLKPIVDRIFIAKDFHMLWFAVAAVPLLIAFKSAASYAQNYLMSWLGQKVTQDVRADLFRQLHALPLEYYADHEAGETLSRVTSDLTIVQAALQSLPLYFIRDTMTVLVLLVSLFYLDWRFALLSLVGVPLTALVLVVLGRKQRATSLESQAVLGRIHQRFHETIHGLKLIRSFNYEDAMLSKFEEENELFFSPTMSFLRATALSAPLMEFSGGLVGGAILYFGGCEVILGRLTPGAFFAFLGAFFAAYAPIKNVARSSSEAQRALASAERIFQLLDEHPASELGGAVARFEGLGREIRLEGVTFRYPGRPEAALDNCTLAIPAGKRTAIVGPSGSGKTTVAQLLLRLYEPSEGAVLFDGVDARQLDPRSLRSHIGLVSQHTMLFQDTLFENIALGRRVVTLTEMERACRLAGAAEFIERLPQSYQTRIGEVPPPMSAGQRQKLAIARIVLKDPSILVLDEATANLDAASEAEVLGSLKRLFHGRTVLMIAHHLTALPDVDHIIVLNNGQVAEEGSRAELLARKGLFRRLYDLQVVQEAEAKAAEAAEPA